MVKPDQADEHRSSWIIRRSQSLRRVNVSCFRLDQDEVGKGATDVAADAKAMSHGFKFAQGTDQLLAPPAAGLRHRSWTL